MKRAEASRRIARIGWAAVAGLAVITGVVLMVVMKKQEHNPGGGPGSCLDVFLEDLKRLDLEDETQRNLAKARIDKERKLWKFTRIAGEVEAIWSKIKSPQLIMQTRALRESLDGIEAKLTDTADLTVLGGLFTSVRDNNLARQAADTGGDLEVRYDTDRRRVADRYVEALRSAADSAATATAGEGLQPYGVLEDTLRILLEEAVGTNDVDAQQRYGTLARQAYAESNTQALRLFDEAYQSKVPWVDLLADSANWQIASSASFTFKFGPGLTMTNEAGEGAESGGLAYQPGHRWRDYVIDIEFKLDAGSMAVYTRVGDRMDVENALGFTVGTKDPNVQVDYGKAYSMVVSVIGNQLNVTVDGTTAYSGNNIAFAKSRKGEPGIFANADLASPTNLTITRLRARLLR